MIEIISQKELVEPIVSHKSKHKTCGIESVPWKNKDEWSNVYKNVYSSMLCDQMEAYNTMLKWQDRKKGCPLGVLCTITILQGVIKDQVFHSDVQQSLTDEDLQFIYGGSIMRLLNFLGSKEVERACGEDKKGLESLYAKAEKMGLPDWIVNVRHEVSHGTAFPKIDLLRMCIIHILKWLKTCYWDIEEKRIHDVVLVKPRQDTLKECFLKLLNTYIHLKESMKKGCKSCKSLKDPLIRKEIFNIESYRLLSEQLENAPWEVSFIRSKRNRRGNKHLTKNDLKTYSLSKISLVAAKYIKEYNVVNHINIWNIINSYLLEDCMKLQCIRLDIWGSLVKALADSGYICRLLDPFLDNVFSEVVDYDKSFWSKKWLIILLQALLKRAKVEKLKLALSGQIRKRRRERRLISTLTLVEKDHLKELIRRTKNDLSKKLKNELYTTLTLIVEKNDRRLQSLLRFTCEPLDEETVKEYIFKVCYEPNDFTFVAFDFFVDMLENPSPKVRKSIKNLINIYQGKKKVDISECSSDVVYTLPMILAKFGIPEEEEYLESEKEFNSKKKDEIIQNEESLSDASKCVVIDAVFSTKSSTCKSSWPPFLQLPWNS